MKRETILKIILVLIMGVVILAKPINLSAVSSNPTDLNAFLEDQGGLEDIELETTTPEPTPEPEPEPTPQPTTPSTNTEKDLPDAGLAEDTVMVVSIAALIAVAIFTFIKISDYSNI